VLIAAMVVALSGLITGCSRGNVTQSSSQNKSPIRIGAILSLSGTYASMGEVQKQTLELEVAHINSSGGVNGHPLSVIIEDDATEESKAVSAAEKLVNKDHVAAIIGATGTGPTMAVRSIVEQAGIPQISMAGGNVITGTLSHNVFQTPWTNALLLDNLFSYLSGQGYTEIALVTDSGGYGKDGRAMAREKAKKYGIDLVVDTTFQPNDTDMSAQIGRVKRSNAQAVVLWNAGKEAATFVKQAKTGGIDIPLFGGSGQARQEFIDGAGPSAQGYTIITGKSFIPASWEVGSDEYLTNSAFASRFKSKYGKNPDIFAGHAYDALHLLVNAVDSSAESSSAKTIDDSDGEPLISSLERTKDFTAFGGKFTYTVKDHNGLGAEDISFFHVDKGAWKIGPGSAVAVASEKTTVLSQIFDFLFASLKSGSIYALIALGFIVVFLATGAINFAQGEFVMLGGMSAAWLCGRGLPVLLAVLASALISVAVGWLFDRILIRPLGKENGVRIVIITVGASVLLRQIALRAFGPDELAMPSWFQGAPIHVFGSAVEVQTLVLFILTALCFGGFYLIFKKTKFGYGMRANEQSSEEAQLCGVDSESIVTRSFVLASLFGALVGCALTPLVQMTFDGGISLGIKGFTVAILGGLSNPLGALGAGAILGGLETATGTFIDPIYKDVVAFIVLILVLIVRPSGIFGGKDKEKH